MMLTELARYAVLAAGRRGKIADLVVELGGGPFPPITHILATGLSGKPSVIPWSSVSWIDRKGRTLLLAAGAVDGKRRDALPETAVWLRRDVLDALIVDVRERRVTRANDLVLETKDDRLALCAVDVSAAAIFRRLTAGRLGAKPSRPPWRWRDVEFLRGDPQAVRDGRHYNRRVDRLRPAEIARICEALPYPHATELLMLLPDQLAADVLEAVESNRQLQIFDELEPRRQTRLLGLMAADEAADLVGRLDLDAASALLSDLPEASANRIAALLDYPSDSAGGIMTNDEVVIRSGLTLAEARSALRDRIRRPDFVYFIYVVDNERDRRLRGVLTMRDVMSGEADRRIDDLMTRELITLAPLTAADAAARRVLDSELLALPVIDADRRLLGVVTVDEAIERIAPSRWRNEAPRLFA